MSLCYGQQLEAGAITGTEWQVRTATHKYGVYLAWDTY